MSKGMRKPHFFKIMLGDFEKRLRIPPNLVENFLKESSKDKVIIRDGDGGAWNVGLERLTSGTFLARGWSKFVKDHNLKQHEFVVFRYDGNMHFSLVLAFDPTACEKDDVVVVVEPSPEPARPPSKKSRISETKQLPNICCHCKKKVHETKPEKVRKVRCSSPDDALEVKTEKETGGCGGKGKRKMAHSLSVGFLARNKRVKTEGVNKIQERQKKLAIWSWSRKAARNGESSVAEKAATQFRSNFPYFMVQIWPSDIRLGHKILPAAFAREHLPRSIMNVILHEANDESWVVVYSPSHDRSKFTEGWSAFAQSCSLQVGDYCAFELVRPDEFRVTVFHNIKMLTRG